MNMPSQIAPVLRSSAGSRLYHPSGASGVTPSVTLECANALSSAFVSCGIGIPVGVMAAIANSSESMPFVMSVAVAMGASVSCIQQIANIIANCRSPSTAPATTLP